MATDDRQMQSRPLMTDSDRDYIQIPRRRHHISFAPDNGASTTAGVVPAEALNAKANSSACVNKSCTIDYFHKEKTPCPFAVLTGTALRKFPPN